MGPVIADPAKGKTMWSAMLPKAYRIEVIKWRSIPFISPLGLTITPALSAKASSESYTTIWNY
jgi:hypothetical protein